MVKPVYVKLDDKLWKKFKAHAKEHGHVLTVAVAEALRRAMGRKAAREIV